MIGRVAGTAVAALLLVAGPASAAEIHPNITTDVVDPGDGHCSLREAVASANGNAPSATPGECEAGDTGADTIVLDAAEYDLTVDNGSGGNLADDLVVNQDLTIQGQGPSATTIAVPAGKTYRAISVLSGVSSFTFTGARITGGRGATVGLFGDSGGAIQSLSTSTTLSNCKFDDNRAGDSAPTPGSAAGGGVGGAVAAFPSSGGEVHVDSCTFDGNRAGAGADGVDGAAGSGDGGGGGGGGGGLFVGGDPDVVTIAHSTFTGNHGGAGGTGGAGATGDTSAAGGRGGQGGAGGGLDIDLTVPSVSVSDTTFSGNTAGTGGAGGDAAGTAGGGGLGGTGGGAVIVGSANGEPGVALDRTRFIDNDAGPAGAAGESSTARAGLTAGGSGGGFVLLVGKLTVSDSTFSGNAAADGQDAEPPGMSTVGTPAGVGGGAGGLQVASDDAQVSGTTISGNTAGSGGAVLQPFNQEGVGGNGGGYVVSGSLLLVNDTISGNSAGDGGNRTTGTGPGAAGGRGGGIRLNAGTLTARHVTLASNVAGRDGGNTATGTARSAGRAGAISANNTGPPFSASAQFTSSILAGNGEFACDGPVSASSANTISFDAVNPSCPGLDVNPQLGALADNGGPTQTMALPAGSPALDLAPSGSCPAADQRGIARPQGTGCDAGAFELEVAAPGPPGPGPGPTPDTTRPRITVKFRKQSLRHALKHGFAASVTSDEAARVVAELRLKGKRIARGSKRLKAAGKARVVAKFPKKTRRKLAKRRRLTLRLRVTATDAAGNVARKSRKVTLKR